ncbi:MAG TPA: hypothetical protein VGP68_14445, partial [Gemmataceae bacterium]|nr:hypothetical protein [Gemmataceae bacterium]
MTSSVNRLVVNPNRPSNQKPDVGNRMQGRWAAHVLIATKKGAAFALEMGPKKGCLAEQR